ncbi:hypothetical protein FQR65_LT19981 [Abscondita terminalis]|nr:hypothetical protein FQR65_LT19981 [Abscondita terminalis]
MEDRKFGDIGNTQELQFSHGIYKIANWADMVTAHAIGGSKALEGFRNAGIITILGMSSKGIYRCAHLIVKSHENQSSNEPMLSGLLAAWKADVAHSHVAFTVVHTGISDISGVFKTFDLAVASQSKDFSDAKPRHTAKADAILACMARSPRPRAPGAAPGVEDPFFSLKFRLAGDRHADITSNNYRDERRRPTQFNDDTLMARGKTRANICAVVANFTCTRKRGKNHEDGPDRKRLGGAQRDERCDQYSRFYETIRRNHRQRLADDLWHDLDAIWCPWDEPRWPLAK